MSLRARRQAARCTYPLGCPELALADWPFCPEHHERTVRRGEAIRIARGWQSESSQVRVEPSTVPATKGTRTK